MQVVEFLFVCVYRDCQFEFFGGLESEISVGVAYFVCD